MAASHSTIRPPRDADAARLARSRRPRRRLLPGAGRAPRGQSAARRAPRRAALPLDQVDSFLAIRSDGTVVVHSGKVDLGTGHRIAMRQMVGEELGVGVDRIELIEGDTALTPNQGPTAGSSGIMRGGVELRQAAATAREALLAMAAERLQAPAGELTLADGEVRAADGRRVAVADAGRRPRLRRQDEPEGAAEAARRSTCSSASRCRGPTFPPRSPGATSTCTTTSCPGCCTAACCGRRRSAPRSWRSTKHRSRAARRARGADRRFRRRRRRRRMGRRARGARAQGAVERERAAGRPRGAARLGARRPVRRRRDDHREGRRRARRRARRRRRCAPRHLFVADPVARLDRPLVRGRRRARRRRHGLDGVAGEPSLPRHASPRSSTCRATSCA